MKVDKTTLIKDVLDMGPKAEEILTGFGMGCIHCPSSQSESLGEAAAVHGIDVEDIIKSLNKIPLGERIKWKLEKKVEGAIKSRYDIKS